MQNYGTIIPIQHEHAQRFFEEARHPNLDSIRRRDAFLERLAREYPCHTEGSNLVMEIPDLDIDALTATTSESSLSSADAAECAIHYNIESR